MFAAMPPILHRSWRAELAATLALAWPLILANLAQTGLMTTDVVLLGWLGPDAIAAAALGTNLYFGLYMFGVGVVVAVSPLVAEELGRNRHAVREVRRTVRQGLWAAVAVSVPIMLILWNGEAVLRLLGQEPRLAAEAGRYLRALEWAVLPGLAFVVLRNFLAALERPGWALFIGLAALPLNALLAYALIHGRFGLPELGVIGAGVATALVNVATFAGLAVIIVTHRRFRRYHLFGRFWRPDWPRFALIWRIGLPIGAILVLEVAFFNAAAFVMGLIGANELAAHAVALQIAATAFMVPLGLGQAATVRVGRALGAGDPAGIGRAGWTAFALAMLFAVVMAALFFAVPGVFVGAFFDVAAARNREVAALVVTFLGFAALFQLADGAQVVAAGMLRGLKDTRVPMLLAAVGYWLVGAPVGVGLGLFTDWRGSGIWTGLAVGLAVVAVALMLRWSARERLGLVPASPGARRGPASGEGSAAWLGPAPSADVRPDAPAAKVG